MTDAVVSTVSHHRTDRHFVIMYHAILNGGSHLLQVYAGVRIIGLLTGCTLGLPR